MMDEPKAFLRACFDQAVAACRPSGIMAAHLPIPPKGRTVVVGAGKAAASMALAFEESWSGPISGMVVTRHGHGAPRARIEVVEAGHPNPDEAGRRAAARMLAMVAGLTPDDLVICLLSGGGSSLLTLPHDSVPFDDIKAVNGGLLRCGAPIDDINRVRAVLSRMGGGRLAVAAWPARVVTLSISDVPGDLPATIASGPTVAPITNPAVARAVLARHGVTPPPSVAAFLDHPDAVPPAIDHPAFTLGSYRLMSSGMTALNAVAAFARDQGITPVVMGDAIQGEARAVGQAMGGIAISTARGATSFPKPCLILSGGETSVTVRGKGRGGRNAEFLLALALEIDGHDGIHAMACDTDGIDGTEDNAGAVADGATAVRARALGMAPRERLDDNDGYTVFQALGDLVVTGPTLTNVNDFRAILVR